MKYTITKNPPKFDIEIDFSVEYSLKSFKEEVLNTLYLHHKSNNIERILLSDGMDSSFISLCLRELDIPINPLSFVFESLSKEIIKKIEVFCSTINVKPDFFIIKEKEFFNFVDFLVYEKKNCLSLFKWILYKLYFKYLQGKFLYWYE